jgi:hypothetical protein
VCVNEEAEKGEVQTKEKCILGLLGIFYDML